MATKQYPESQSSNTAGETEEEKGKGGEGVLSTFLCSSLALFPNCIMQPQECKIMGSVAKSTDEGTHRECKIMGSVAKSTDEGTHRECKIMGSVAKSTDEGTHRECKIMGSVAKSTDEGTHRECKIMGSVAKSTDEGTHRDGKHSYCHSHCPPPHGTFLG